LSSFMDCQSRENVVSWSNLKVGHRVAAENRKGNSNTFGGQNVS
jgi:hypothetical protein